MTRQIVRDALTSTQNIDGVLKGYKTRRSSRILGKYAPVMNWNRYKVQLEIDLPTNASGATPLTAAYSDPSMVNFTSARGSIEYDAPMWAEKTSIVPEEVEDLRRLGTYNELVGARELLQRKIGMMETRLQNRMEIMLQEMIFEGVVRGQTADGFERTWQYQNHPDFMDVQAANSWDDNATADPIVDLIEWKDIWEEHSTFELREIILPHGSLRRMGFIDQVRDKALQNWAVIKDGPSGAQQILQLGLGSVPMYESNERIESVVHVMNPAAAGATSVTLSNVYGLSVGSTLTLVQPMGPSENVLVSAIVGKVVTFATTPLQHSYSAYAGAKFRRWIIPLDTALLLGGNEVALETEGDQVTNYIGGWANILAPLHLANDMEVPTSGMYYKVVDKSKDHAASIEYSLGGKFIPVQWDGTGYMKAKIFF